MASAEQQSDSLNIQLLVDSIPALIHTARPDGYLDYFNKPWLDFLGAALDEVTGWNWTAFIHPDDVDGIVAQWQACLVSGETFERETRVRRANGEYRWMFHRKVPLRDSKGHIVKWYGSSLDIDERKAAEKALRSSEAYLAEAQRLTQTGSWAFDPATGEPRYWSEECYRVLGFDPAGPLPRLEAIFERIQPDDARVAIREQFEKGVRDKTDFELDLSFDHPTTGIRNIRSTGHSVVDTRGDLREVVGTVMDITEHKRAEESIRRSEAYLAEAQRLSHTGSFGWKPSTGDIVWSDETYRIFECDRTEKPTLVMVLQRVHPEDRAEVQKVLDKAHEGTDFEHSCRLLLPDGRVKHIHALAHVVHSSNNLEFVGAVTDVTEGKLAKEGLRESEEKFRLVLESIGAQVIITTLEGELEFVNQPVLDYFGKTMEQLKGWRTSDVIHPDDLPSAIAAWKGSIEKAASYDLDHRFRRSDGVYRWFHVVGRPQLDAKGDIVRWYTLLTDIDDRKRAEEELRGQQAELRQILDLVPQHAAVFGPGGERIFANRFSLEYVGLTLEEWRQTPGGPSSPGWFIHPDDRERAARGFSEGARGGGHAFEMELRVQRADRCYRWFLLRFNPLHDDKGQIMRWYVASADIDERKQAEEALRRENVVLREEVDKTSMFEEIVGTSPALKAVLSRISKVAPGNSTVLITGETGTGKELVARAIHRRSDRDLRAFVSVNCAAIPRELIASELFGHEKGAFTGATQQRLGRFELANGGTLFLDEVGEIPAETQIALLRVLQEHEFERVGGTHPIRADVRVIAATNRDLESAVRTGSFRSDLFYRLHVFPIEIPPLRERKEDIRLLVEYFIERYARKAGKRISTIDKKTLRLLESYPWPGNIRELQNVIERSIIVCEAENLSVDESWLSRQPIQRKGEPHLYLSEKMAAQEKEAIEAALRECKGRVFGPSGAAAKLGIARTTLESKIQALKINKNRFKP